MVMKSLTHLDGTKPHPWMRPFTTVLVIVVWMGRSGSNTIVGGLYGPRKGVSNNVVFFQVFKLGELVKENELPVSRGTIPMLPD